MNLKLVLKQKPESLLVRQAEDGLENLLRRKDLGFFELHERTQISKDSVDLVQSFRNRKVTDLVMVGVGGSSMGPQVVRDFFQRSSSPFKVHFLDNVDFLQLQDLLESLPDVKTVAWAFISKSGSTLETLALLEIIYQKLGPVLLKNSVVISEMTDNPLTIWARANQLPQLEIPEDVGGRFSIFSAVGLLPAAFLGVDLERIHQGCRAALSDRKMIAEVVAEALASFARKDALVSSWSYSSQLRSFGGWFQQLWAESLAKTIDRKGKAGPFVSTPIPQIGACDQHSVLQQFMEGPLDKWVVFQRVLETEKRVEPIKENFFGETSYWKNKSLGEILSAEADATENAMSSRGIRTLQLQIKDFSPESFGQLLMFWQLVVGSLGECLDIDAFNQPGVELGKRLAKESLKA